jgi:hypothetical protein
MGMYCLSGSLLEVLCRSRRQGATGSWKTLAGCGLELLDGGGGDMSLAGSRTASEAYLHKLRGSFTIAFVQPHKRRSIKVNHHVILHNQCTPPESSSEQSPSFSSVQSKFNLKMLAATPHLCDTTKEECHLKTASQRMKNLSDHFLSILKSRPKPRPRPRFLTPTASVPVSASSQPLACPASLTLDHLKPLSCFLRCAIISPASKFVLIKYVRTNCDACHLK